MDCEAQLAWKCLFTHTFSVILTFKVGQTDLVLVYNQGSLLGLCFIHCALFCRSRDGSICSCLCCPVWLRRHWRSWTQTLYVLRSWIVTFLNVVTIS